GRGGRGRGARGGRPRLRRALRPRDGRARHRRGRDGRPHRPRARMSRFLERLADGTPIVADGGMGALLSSAVAGLRCPEEANLRAPESVLEVHVGYIRAGAELIETNTFGANRAKLSRQFLADELEQINAAAVRIAREAREVAGRDVFIAGSIGPLGDVELGGLDSADLFAEQARVLEGRGVDLFMVETFYDLDELETAIAAVRSVSALPLVALLTFDAGGETLAGVKAEDAAARLRPLGLAAYGANHGAGPAAALTALAQMGGDGEVLAALPNVGLLRGVRGAGACARCTSDRRLLRHDAGPGRRDPRGGGRKPPSRRLLPRPGARAGRTLRADDGRDAARAPPARGRVRD